MSGLLLLVFLVLSAGYLVVELTSATLLFSDVAALTLCFAAITLLSLSVFQRGRNKEPGSQTMHLFVALAVKMLLEMVLALLWFVIAKKPYPSNLLLFFVLYLAFTLYSIILMLNTLKSKSL